MDEFSSRRQSSDGNQEQFFFFNQEIAGYGSPFRPSHESQTLDTLTEHTLVYGYPQSSVILNLDEWLKS